MKRFFQPIIYLIFLTSFSPPLQAQPPAMIHYQGRIVDGTNLINGTLDIRFRLHTDPISNSVVYEATNTITVVDGLYSTVIGEHTVSGSLDSALQNPEVWLELTMDATTLTPRERLLAVPYARRVPGIEMTPSSTMVGNTDSGNHVVAGNASHGVIAGGTLNTVEERSDYVVLGGGFKNRIGDDADFAVISGGASNVVFGPAGIIPGGTGNTAGDHAYAAGNRARAIHSGSFVWGDSTDEDVFSSANDQVTFRAQGGYRLLGGPLQADAGSLSNFPLSLARNYTTTGVARVLLSTEGSVLSDYSSVLGGESNVVSQNSANSLIGGGTDNVIHENASESVIAGGAGNQIYATESFIGGGYENIIEMFSDSSTIGGGTRNIIQFNTDGGMIAGGFDNTIGTNGNYSVISGGRNNEVENDAFYAAIGGGWTNEVSGSYSTIGGGLRNIASGADSTIGGGHLNEASGFRSAIPGGSENDAAGDYSFAAGRRARALHDGSMVMADSTGASFSSTSPNQFLIRAQGGVGIGTASPAAALQVDAEAGEHPLRVRSDGVTKLYVQDNGGTSIGAFGGASEDGLHVAGRTGLGVTDPIERLHISGGLHIENTIRDISVPVTDNIQMGHYDGTNFTERMRIAPGGRVAIGLTNPHTDSLLHVNGNIRAETITLTGGADLAEPFPISGTGPIPPGSVMIIDPDRPGFLKESEAAYDRKVAGILSGAEGVKPGIILSQENKLSEGRPVAMTGRVYVRADASKHSITPGDLLTSSDLPGHAQKVTDYQRAQGAMIGKAMSSLSDGQGYVLVLIGLQ